MAALLAACIVLAANPADAIDVPIKNVAQIKIDDEGRLLVYPAAVFFDPVLDETYVINGGSGRVVVYGPDFFPRSSIGAGRGVLAPRGGEILPNGEIYICQIRNVDNPIPRITVLNGAFFVEREILLDQVPGEVNLVPRKAAVSPEGLIYLAADNVRGALVFDSEGAFLRRLQPMDQVYYRGLAREKEARARREGEQEDSEAKAAEVTEEATPAEEDPFADIPEEFRPRSSDENEPDPSDKVEGPVKINYVTIDRAGRLYLLSAETGKIYVFGPDESFLFSFGTKGGSPGQMSQPRALAIDEKREILYVPDYMRHTVLVYDMAGEYLFELGGRGTSPGWFNFPAGIAVNDFGQIIVADLFNRRVQVLEVPYEEVVPYLRGSEKPSAEESSEFGDRVIPEEFLPGRTGDAAEEESLEETEVPEPVEEEVESERSPPEDLSEEPAAGVEEVLVPIVEIPGYSETEDQEQPAPEQGLPPDGEEDRGTGSEPFAPRPGPGAAQQAN